MTMRCVRTAVPVLALLFLAPLPARATECVSVGPSRTAADFLREATVIASGRVAGLRIESEVFDMPAQNAPTGITVFTTDGRKVGCRERVVYTIELVRVWKAPTDTDWVLEVYGDWDLFTVRNAKLGSVLFFAAYTDAAGKLFLHDAVCYDVPRDPSDFGAPVRSRKLLRPVVR